MVETVFVLVAGEITVFAEGSDVEPVAVGVERILGEVFIPFDIVLAAEFAGFGPGLGFDAEQFDVARVVVVFD